MLFFAIWATLFWPSYWLVREYDELFFGPFIGDPYWKGPYIGTDAAKSPDLATDAKR